MVNGHKNDDTPVGANSPFSILAWLHGKILMLGCGLCPNTSMHGIEELTRPPYLLKKEKTLFTLIDSENKRSTAEYYCHDFSGWMQRYDKVSQLLSFSELKRGHVMEAECFLIDAASLWEKAKNKLIDDPFFFVEKIRCI
jgi:aminoglycoside 3-N-acetyltransferase